MAHSYHATCTNQKYAQSVARYKQFDGRDYWDQSIRCQGTRFEITNLKSGLTLITGTNPRRIRPWCPRGGGWPRGPWSPGTTQQNRGRGRRKPQGCAGTRHQRHHPYLQKTGLFHRLPSTQLTNSEHRIHLYENTTHLQQLPHHSMNNISDDYRNTVTT